jgi:hypothetical protein
MLVAIAKLNGFMFAGGSAAGHRSTAQGSVAQKNVGFNRRIAAGIKDFTRVYVNNV